MKDLVATYPALSGPKERRGYKTSVGLVHINCNFLSLIIITIATVLLVISDKKQFSVSGCYYIIVQIVVQIISASFGFLQQSIIY